MKLVGLGIKNLGRNKLRTALTVVGVAVAILAFMLIRTVLSAWTVAIDAAANDRFVTRHKVSFIMSMPARYVQEVENLPGVATSLQASWFGGKDPNHENDFFNTIAVDPGKFLEVYNEVVVPEDQKAAWLQDRQGALVGDFLATKFGWKVGDKVTLRGTIYSGDWQFTISGIYTTTRRSLDRSSFWFHYDYLNQWLVRNWPSSRDQVGWIISRVDDPAQTAQIAKQVDARFEERDIQTASMDERAFNTSFLGMISAVLAALDLVSVVILLIMVLILGNTIAMGVRERTHEYGVMRAIGFRPAHLASFILGEAVAVGLLGGVLGIAISYPFVEQGVGRFLEENMGGLFPYVDINPATSALALALAVGLGLLAACVPAYRASKLEVTTALRKVG